MKSSQEHSFFSVTRRVRASKQNRPEAAFFLLSGKYAGVSREKRRKRAGNPETAKAGKKRDDKSARSCYDNGVHRKRARRGVRSAPFRRSGSCRARKKGVFSIRHSADNTNTVPCPSVPRLTALDRYGDPYLPGLPGMTDPCEACPEDRVCRECRYSAVVKALYCHEEAEAARTEHRFPVPPRTLPRPHPVFSPRKELPDPVSVLCEALFLPFCAEKENRQMFPDHERKDASANGSTDQNNEESRSEI